MYFGTRIGMAARGDDLDVVCVRGRGSRVKVTGCLRIENFTTRPAAEIAREYRRFRDEQRAQTVSATVALPRGAGLIRTLELPAEAAGNLAQTVGYQVEALHPFEEGGVYFDYALLGEPAPPAGGHAAGGTAAPANGSGQRVRVAVGLIEKRVADELHRRFAECGIDLAGITLSTAAVHAALWQAPGKASAPSGIAAATATRPAVVFLDASGSTVELLAIAEDGRFCSRETEWEAHSEDDDPGEGMAGLGREVALCLAELRLPPGSPVVLASGGDAVDVAALASLAGDQGAVTASSVERGLLPLQPEISSPSFRLKEHFVAYAAALGALQVRLPLLPSGAGLRWNLLPAAYRVRRSHWAQATAVALAALVAVLALAWPATNAIQDQLYLSWLNRQIQGLAPRVQYVEKLDNRQKETLARLELLERQRSSISRQLEAWQELTRLLPNTVWLTSMQMNANQVLIVGQADTAGGLLQLLSQSSHFEQPEFATGLTRTPEGREVFQVRMRLRETPTVAPTLVTAAAQAAPSPAAATAPPAAPGAALTPMSPTAGEAKR